MGFAIDRYSGACDRGTASSQLESSLVKLSILRIRLREPGRMDFVKLCPICLSYRSRSARWSFYVTVLPGITAQSRVRPAIFRRLKLDARPKRVIRTFMYADTVTEGAAGACSFFSPSLKF